MRYLVYQREIAPTSGREHWQGAVAFFECQAGGRVQEQLGGGSELHVELSRSDACYAYCTKEETRKAGTTPREFGAKPGGRGARVDWTRIRDDCKAGKDDAHFATVYPQQFVQCSRGIREMRSVLTGKPREPSQGVFVTVFWGVTNAGKSTRAYNEALGIAGSSSGVYVKRSDHWWSGYDGQKCVIIDEFEPSEMGKETQVSYWLSIFQPFPIRVKTYNTERQLEATHFWITANTNPQFWWGGWDYEEKARAFKRRLTHIEQFTAAWSPGAVDDEEEEKHALA